MCVIAGNTDEVFADGDCTDTLEVVGARVRAVYTNQEGDPECTDSLTYHTVCITFTPTSCEYWKTAELN